MLLVSLLCESRPPTASSCLFSVTQVESLTGKLVIVSHTVWFAGLVRRALSEQVKTDFVEH